MSTSTTAISQKCSVLPLKRVFVPSFAIAHGKKAPAIPVACAAPPASFDAAIGRLRAAPRLFAKLYIHNAPFTVHPGDRIVTHRMPDVRPGDVLVLDRVRAVGSEHASLEGSPILPRSVATVTAVVLEHTRGAKRRARMSFQRKGRRILHTIKPRITVLRVRSIDLPAVGEQRPDFECE